MSKRSIAVDAWFEPFAISDANCDEPSRRHPERVAREIEIRIRERLGGRIRDLQVACDGESIVLCGKCHTYHSKQLAQHAAQGVVEDEVLSNQIEVCL
jgi:hypothetical protein